MNYTSLIAALNQSINNRVTTVSTPDGIDPVAVGGSMTDIGTTLLPVLNKINAFNIIGGTAAPTAADGDVDDIYFQWSVGAIAIHKKATSATWSYQITVPLGISIPDGNINVFSRVQGDVVTASAGAWGLDNTIYQTAVQTQFTLTPSNLNYDRIDAVFGNTSGALTLVDGVASADPDATKPTTPADNVIITYIYVPSTVSGGLPYISDSNAAGSDKSVIFKNSLAEFPTEGQTETIYIALDTFKDYVWYSGAYQPLNGGGGGGSTAFADITGDPEDNEALAAALGEKADLNSPALTGAPTAPTAVVGTNTDQLATTQFVRNEIDGYIDATRNFVVSVDQLNNTVVIPFKDYKVNIDSIELITNADSIFEYQLIIGSDTPISYGGLSLLNAAILALSSGDVAGGYTVKFTITLTAGKEYATVIFKSTII